MMLRPIHRSKGRGVSLRLAVLALALASFSPAAMDPPNPETLRLEQSRMESDRVERLFDEGGELPLEKAKTITAELSANLTDLARRLRLMGHYEAKTSAREEQQRKMARKRHDELLLGIVRHHPRSLLAGDIGIMLDPAESETARREGAEIWNDLTEHHQVDPLILGNAGAFFVSDLFDMKSQRRGIELLERARGLDPENPRWAEEIGNAYAEQMTMRHDLTKGRRQEAARKALRSLEAFHAMADQADPYPRAGRVTFPAARRGRAYPR